MTNRLRRSSGPPGTVLANAGQKSGPANFVNLKKLITQLFGNTITTTSITGTGGITVTPTGPNSVVIGSSNPPGNLRGQDGERGPMGPPGPVGPAGAGASAFSTSITASESLAAGALVNLFTSSGALKMRNANATDATKPAHGFVLSAVLSGASGTMYGPGQAITGLTGLTPGTVYYTDTSGAGGVTSTAPSSSGNVIQQAGVALSATSLLFNPQVATVQI